MADDGQEGVVDAVGAFAEIQRRSLDAAASLVERLVSTVDGQRPTSEGDTPADASGVPGGVDDLVAGWARLWRQSLTSLAGVVVDGGGVRPDGVGLQVGGPVPLAPVRLVCDDAGAATVEVWIHNPTEDDRLGLRVHVTPPCAHDGKPLEGSIDAEPELLDLPARSGRGVRLRVDAAGTPIGTYRGLVLVDGLPDQWLALEVVVAPEAP